MRWRVKTEKRSLAEELAVAISRFDLAKAAEFLADNGRFSVQNSVHETMISGKDQFISWIDGCYEKKPSGMLFRKRLQFFIVKSMHSLNDSSIILFENGKFPLLSSDQGVKKSGLVVTADKGKVISIGLCLLEMKTESPFIYERKMLG